MRLLEELGLREAAAAIYLHLLESKKATILEIAQHTGIARTNIYHNCRVLIKMNLVSQVIEGKRKFLVPESPDNLVSMIHAKSEVAKQAARILQGDYEKGKYEAKIRFGEGEEGFKKFAEEVLEAKEHPVRQIIAHSALTGFVSKRYLVQYWQRRARKGIPIKILIPFKEKNLVHTGITVTDNIKMLREFRFLPDGLDLKLSLVAFDDKVIFFAPPTEGYSFIFESAAFTQTVKNIFDFLWGVSEQFGGTQVVQ